MRERIYFNRLAGALRSDQDKKNARYEENHANILAKITRLDQ